MTLGKTTPRAEVRLGLAPPYIKGGAQPKLNQPQPSRLRSRLVGHIAQPHNLNRRQMPPRRIIR